MDGLAWACALAIALGISFRCRGLETALVWHDEVATRILCAGHTPDDWRETLYSGEVLPVGAVRAWQRIGGVGQRGDLGEIVSGLVRTDPQHPPLYYVLAWMWTGFFGDGIAALRALSVIASLLGLPAAFLLARHLFASTRAAWLATASFALSPFFVLYAQEAREYAMWSSLILASSAALISAMRRSERGRAVGAWVLYGVLLLLAFYTSFSTAWVGLSHTLFVAIDRRGRLDRVAWTAGITLALVALAVLPWALLLMRNWDAFEISMRWSRDIVIPRASLLRILVLNTSRTVVDFWADLDDGLAYAVDGAAVALVTAAITGTRRAGWRAAAFLLTLGAVPLLATLGPDLWSGGIRSVSSRYLTPTWIAALLALAGWLGGGSPFRLRVAGPVLLVAAAASLVRDTSQRAVWTKGTGIRLPEVADIINASARPLVVGDMEHHNPGDLLSLSNLLGPDAAMQLLRMEMQRDYRLPPREGAIWLYNPIPPFRERIEEIEGRTVTRVFEALDVELYRVGDGPARARR
jgi:uncharacterized membrane protein